MALVYNVGLLYYVSEVKDGKSFLCVNSKTSDDSIFAAGLE